MYLLLTLTYLPNSLHLMTDVSCGMSIVGGRLQAVAYTDTLFHHDRVRGGVETQVDGHHHWRPRRGSCIAEALCVCCNNERCRDTWAATLKHRAMRHRLDSGHVLQAESPGQTKGFIFTTTQDHFGVWSDGVIDEFSQKDHRSSHTPK